MGKNQYISKHVRVTAEHGFPEPSGDQFIVRLVRSRGGNIMECENSDGTTILCLLPAKFSKVRHFSNEKSVTFLLNELNCHIWCQQVVWAQRGDFLIAEPSSVDGGQGKLSATIVHILFPEQVKHLRTLACWPSSFDTSVPRDSEETAASRQTLDDAAETRPLDQTDEDSGSDVDLFQNTNRMHYDSYDEENDSEEEEEEEKDG